MKSKSRTGILISTSPWRTRIKSITNKECQITTEKNIDPAYSSCWKPEETAKSRPSRHHLGPGSLTNPNHHEHQPAIADNTNTVVLSSSLLRTRTLPTSSFPIRSFFVFECPSSSVHQSSLPNLLDLNLTYAQTRQASSEDSRTQTSEWVSTMSQSTSPLPRPWWQISIFSLYTDVSTPAKPSSPLSSRITKS